MYKGKTSPVTILFEGMVVFCKNEHNDRYEFGILAPDVAVNHEFNISVGSESGDSHSVDVERFLRMGNIWTIDVLDINSGDIRKDLDKTEKGHDGRLRDNPAGQSDFSWLMDLESNEFHREPLNLRAGKLKPIIHLTRGNLFTKFKSIELARKQGKGEFYKFGFVTETLGIDIALRPDEELVFRVANAGQEGEICRARGKTIVVIGNTTIPHINHSDDGPTHLQHYYK
jgi:hypothetical protein